MIYMDDVTQFIPETVLSIEEWGAQFSLDALTLKIFKKMYGIHFIPIAKDIDPIDFIQRPVAQLIEKNNIHPDKIKFLIHAHTGKPNCLFGNSIVRAVKRNLGLTKTAAFGTSVNNCASTFMSFDLLNHLLAYASDELGIIVCGDLSFTSVLQYIPNTAILGDASVAILIKRHATRNQLLSLRFHTEGKFAKGIWMEEESQLFELQYPYLLSTIIKEAVNEANLSLNQIKLIFPHNVNMISWQRVANQLQYPLEKIYLSNVSKYSHCFGADNFINYLSAKDEGLVSPGDYYVMATVGLGAVFAAAVFRV